MFRRKDSKLGVAQGKRLYDLPLNKGQGAGFLVLLIALMTFLAVMALAASFALGAMTDRWSSGLENKLTVEIPAETKDGDILPAYEITALTKKIAETLRKNRAVKSVDILGEEDIQDLVSPWLGEDIALNNIPLPGLISVQLHRTNPVILEILDRAVRDISPSAYLDTHESWLNDLLRFTGALQLAAALITVIIAVTSITAVAGAIRARMAVHRSEVELLHLMGAKDDYITRQFQRHALVLALQGSLLGTAIGGLAMMLISFISGETAAALIPDFRLSGLHILMLFSLPAIACGISTVTARFTVLRALARMP